MSRLWKDIQLKEREANVEEPKVEPEEEEIPYEEVANIMTAIVIGAQLFPATLEKIMEEDESTNGK